MVSDSNSSRVIEGLLFTKIFRTFRMAIQPTKLIIIFFALIIICLAGWLMDRNPTVAVAQNSNGDIIETELQIYTQNPSHVKKFF